MVLTARVCLGSLWLSQVARILADNCLRVFVVLEVAQASSAGRDAAWHIVSGLLALPAVVLAPINGALSNSLPKRGVLAGTTAFCLAVLVLFGTLGGPWLLCWALVAVAWVIYSPTRYALLPAAAEATHIPLTRVNGWIEMGAGSAVVAGMLLGGSVHGASGVWLVFPVAIAISLVLNVVGLLAALPVSFATDVCRAEPPGQALAGFFADVGRVWHVREARTSLWGLAGLRGLITAISGAVVAFTLAATAERQEASIAGLVRAGAWILVGVAAGSLLAGAQPNRWRSLGLVPLGATGLALGLLVAALVPATTASAWLCVPIGMMCGLINIPLAATYQIMVPADARGNAMAIRNLAEYLLITVFALLMAGLAYAQVVTPIGQLFLVFGFAATAAVATWPLLLQQCLEQISEIVIAPFYRIRAHGPGRELFPLEGPVLIVANHTAWLDPFFLGKWIPRPVTPMMTSIFYDLPIIRWLVSHVVHAIRVEAAAFRREAPELKEGIAVLDRGGCLLLFPEGILRRRANQPLRKFGQGVWHILHQRPETPVVVCWIEGGWGSYTSYAGGPPATNKRMDWWRSIDVAMQEPIRLDAKLLDDQRATRTFLMQRCLDARRYLGLEPVPQEAAETLAASKEDEAEGSG